jgi:hypothetical protein
MKLARTATALLGAAALAMPAAAVAKGHPADAGHGHGHGQSHAQSHARHQGNAHAHAHHRVTYVFRGTWSGGAVEVTGGNRHVRRAGLVGQTVELDLSHARVVVRDLNGDGARDLADVQDGDRVLVQARLPKGDPGDAPYAARKLVDRARSHDEQDAQELQAT